MEQTLVEQVLRGDVDAYRNLMDLHHPAVLRMTYHVTGSAEDAEEAAQEAFLRAYRKLPGFRRDASFRTWVYRIAMNCALTLVERRSRDVGWNAVPLDNPASPAEQVSCPLPTPEAHLLEAERSHRWNQLLAGLTPMERTAFILRHIEEQPVSEIAFALHISPNTARQTIFRAISKLRRVLQPVSSAPVTPSALQTTLQRETR